VALRRFLTAEPTAAAIAWSFPAAVRMAAATFGRSVPLLWACHFEIEGELGLLRPRRRVALLALAARGVTMVCGSEAMLRRAAALGYPRARLRLIRAGAELARSRLAGDAADRRARRLALGIPEGDLVVALVARIDPVKDHGLAIRAVAQAARGGTRVVLVCVGGASEGHRAHASALERLARDLGVGDQIVWCGHQPDVNPWLLACDGAALTSMTEVVPLALLEAGACGLPLVATDVGGTREIVAHGHSGLLIDRGDLSAYAAAFVALARDAGLRQRLGAGAAELVREHFDVARMEDEWRTLLSSVTPA
jgi:glycosyltransferase involved in cell wall biosynthesis